MKPSLKLVFATAALVLGAFAPLVQAQQELPPPPPHGEGFGHGRNPQEAFLQMLIEKISLTNAQQTKVIAILADEKASMDALRDSAQTTDFETLRPKIDAIIKSHRAQIRELLTAEQQKIFDQLKPARHGPPPPPPCEGAVTE